MSCSGRSIDISIQFDRCDEEYHQLLSETSSNKSTNLKYVLAEPGGSEGLCEGNSSSYSIQRLCNGDVILVVVVVVCS